MSRPTVTIPPFVMQPIPMLPLTTADPVSKATNLSVSFALKMTAITANALIHIPLERPLAKAQVLPAMAPEPAAMTLMTAAVPVVLRIATLVPELAAATAHQPRSTGASEGSSTDTATMAAVLLVAPHEVPPATTSTVPVVPQTLPAAKTVAPAITERCFPVPTVMTQMAMLPLSARSALPFSRSRNSSQRGLQAHSSSPPSRLPPTHPSLRCQNREQAFDQLKIIHCIFAISKPYPSSIPLLIKFS